MSYQKQPWRDRLVQFPRRYGISSNGGSAAQLVPTFNDPRWSLHENTRMRITNYVGKEPASNTVNANFARQNRNASLSIPTTAYAEFTQTGYNRIAKLDGDSYHYTSLVQGERAQHIFGIDLIAFVMRTWGVGVFGAAISVTDRVAWLKANVSKLLINWVGWGTGYAVGLGSYKANFALWQAGNATVGWGTPNTNTASTPTRTSIQTNATHIASDGFVYFTAYAETTGGNIPNPTTGAELSVESAPAGGLPTGTYRVTYRYMNDADQTTLVSPEMAYGVQANQTLTIKCPIPPAGMGVTKIGVHVNQGANSGKLQGYADISTGVYKQLIPVMDSGADRPFTNTLPITSSIFTDFIEMGVYMMEGSVPQDDYALTLGSLTTAPPLSTLDLPFTRQEFSIGFNTPIAGSYVKLSALDDKGAVLTVLRDTTLVGKGSFTYTTPIGTATLRLQLYGITPTSATFTFSEVQIVRGATLPPWAPQELFEIVPAAGTISEAGTPLNAANLGIREDALVEASAWAEWAYKAVNTSVEPQNVNLDTYTKNGIYDIQSNHASMPPSYRAYVVVMAHPTNKLYIKQMAYEFAGDRIWTRVMAGSGWTVWKQVSSDVIALATNTNVNGLKVTGTYWSTASATANNPTTNNTVYIEHTEFDSNYAAQVATGAAENRMWMRKRTNPTTWTPWLQVDNTITVLLAGTNLNNLTQSGSYYSFASASAANNPTSTDVFYVDHTQSVDAAYASQIARNLASSRTYVRNKVNGTWSAWTQISNETVALGVGTNLNDIVQTGRYYVDPSGINAPSKDFYYIDHVNHPADMASYMTQTAYYVYNSAMYTRRKSAGVWTAWAIVYTETLKPYTSGFYTGNGTPTRTVSLPFVPSAVFVYPQNGVAALLIGSEVTSYSGFAVAGSNGSGVDISGASFIVRETGSGGNRTNTTNNAYHYIAYR